MPGELRRNQHRPGLRMQQGLSTVWWACFSCEISIGAQDFIDTVGLSTCNHCLSNRFGNHRCAASVGADVVAAGISWEDRGLG